MTFGTAAEYLACERADSAACLILEMLLPNMHGLDLQKRLPHENSFAELIRMAEKLGIPATTA